MFDVIFTHCSFLACYIYFHFMIFRKSYRCKGQVSSGVLVNPEGGQSMTHRQNTKTESIDDGVVHHHQEAVGRKTSVVKQIAATPNPQNSSNSGAGNDTDIRSTNNDVKIGRDAPRLEDKMALLKVCSISKA